MGSLNSVGMRAISFMRMIDTAESFVGLINLSYSIQDVMSKISNEVDTSRIGRPNIDYKEAMRSASYTLPPAILFGMPNWTEGYTKSARRHTLKSFLLYVPLVKAGGIGSIALKTPIKIRFGRKNVPLKLVFGGPRKASGSIMGIGLEMGGLRQLIRMDYHQYAKGHGGASGKKPNEQAVWRDGNYHYHINKW